MGPVRIILPIEVAAFQAKKSSLRRNGLGGMGCGVTVLGGGLMGRAKAFRSDSFWRGVSLILSGA